MSIKRKILVFIVAMYFTALSAMSTTLPDNVLQTIKSQCPNVSVRFDGLITLQDGTIYIPVLPSNPKRNAQGKIVSTVPANRKLSQKPDIVLFDSNFALLRVIKSKDGKLGIAPSSQIPFIVKTGIFPQDMLVPPGLVIPDDLQIMMGDLKIATVSSRVNDIFKTTVGVDSKSKTTANKIVPIPYMAGKTLLVTTLDSTLLSVIPSDSTTPKFTLRLENLPKFVQPVSNDDYVLIAAAGKTYIDVADVKNEVLAKKIDLTFQPSEIVLNSDKSKAFVSVVDDQSIFVIDIKSMSLLEKIKVKGYPKHIAISPDNKQIAYQDKNTGDIYTLSLEANYLNKYVYNASNISKIVVDGNNIYLLSRTENCLQVIDSEIKDIIYKQDLAKKPVDMLLIKDKLYILCATNELDIFNLNNFECIRALQLPAGGFSKKLVVVPNSNLLLITNVSDKKYYVYDMVKNTILQTVQTSVYINDLQLLNKRLN